jgi:hypothetical protein
VAAASVGRRTCGDRKRVLAPTAPPAARLARPCVAPVPGDAQHPSDGIKSQVQEWAFEVVRPVARQAICLGAAIGIAACGTLHTTAQHHPPAPQASAVAATVTTSPAPTAMATSPVAPKTTTAPRGYPPPSRPTSPPRPTPRPTSLPLIPCPASEFLCIDINAARRAAGLPLLSFDAALAAKAQAHTDGFVASQKFTDGVDAADGSACGVWQQSQVAEAASWEVTWWLSGPFVTRPRLLSPTAERIGTGMSYAPTWPGLANTNRGCWLMAADLAP